MSALQCRPVSRAGNEDRRIGVEGAGEFWGTAGKMKVLDMVLEFWRAGLDGYGHVVVTAGVATSSCACAGECGRGDGSGICVMVDRMED